MMFPMFDRPATRAARRAVLPALAASAALLLSACGGEDGTVGAAEAISTTVAPPSSTSTTTTTSSTSTSTTTTSTSTTTVPSIGTTTVGEPDTTLAFQDTEPIDPPADAHADEPVIEVGTIAIPKIGVEMTMYEGIRLTTLDLGPGHWPGTALPGQVGNVVVGGHRTSKHRVFRDLDQLAAGDEIIFTEDDGVFTYVVDRVEIVEPTDVWIVDPTPTPTATLFACHPPGSTAQRIAVFANLATS
jgi:sortase A